MYPSVRQGRLELDPQLAHVDVDGAVAGAQLPAPDQLEELRAADDPPGSPGEGDEQLELAHGEHERAPRGDGEAAVGEDLEVADDEPLVGEAVVVHAVTLRRAGVAAVISW